MGSQPHADTLFHLVPANQVAAEALHHPDNKQFVSTSQKGHLGLEIGCHVPSTPRGHVIARLGRNADLILRSSSPNYPMSAVHVAFELHPKTLLVLISVRSKRISSVKFRISEDHPPDSPTEESSDVPTEKAEETITGDGVILYGQEYDLTIEQHKFHLVWRNFYRNVKRNTDALRELARRGCEQSLHRVQQLRSRDRPTDYDHSEALSWHVTRLKTTKDPKFEEVENGRTEVGSGTFGRVFRSVDRATGHYFAIKVFDMNKCDPNFVEYARALLHREIKTMQALTHTHIIEYLGNQRFETPYPELLMPYRDGNLAGLALMKDDGPPEEHLPLDRELLCFIVLEQMLSALDYLASKGIIHRDVKPENILYYDHNGNFVFQLADFGLANHHSLADTKCGTPQFLAPELVPELAGIDRAQSPKIDVWSLCATIFAVKSAFKGFPPRTNEYKVVLNATVPYLEPMARKDPEHRAAASSMLVWLFDGRGLTTSRSRVPPIPPVPPTETNIGGDAQTNQLPTADVASNHARPVSRDRVHNTRQRAKRTTRAHQRLITYPQEIQSGPENPQPALQPRQHGGRGGGVTKRRAEPRAARTTDQDNLAGPSRRRGREQEPRQAQRTPVYDYRMDLD